MFVALERLLSLDAGYRRVFRAGTQPAADGRKGTHAAVGKSLPTPGASLHIATLAGTALRCARHGVESDLASGRALTAPCADRVGIDR